MSRRYIFLLMVLVLFIGSFFVGKYSYSSPSLPHHSDTYDPIEYTPKEVEALSKRNDVVILDVRSQKEYDKGHIPGAVHVNYYDEDQLALVSKGKTPITYCTYSTWRGQYAAYLLYKAGFSPGILSDGITGWKQDIKTLNGILNDNPALARHPRPNFPPITHAPIQQTETKEFTINAAMFSFSLGRITVKKGTRVKLHITSQDVTHGFVLPEYGIKEELLPGVTKDIEFLADRTGEFPFVCSVYCGHDHSSMVGEIIVQ